MPEFEISVEEDYIESLAKLRNPIIAIEELIWNSLDADATKVDVKLTFNQIGGLTKIQVTDNGMGIKYNEYMQAFGGLGGSAKKEMRLTSKGRIPHGKSGKGRFKAFGLGPSVTWTSRYLENGKIQKFEITGHRSHLKRFEVSEKKELKGKKTGVKVTVSGMADHFPSALDPASAVLELSKRLALY
ncbi:MAG: ATP-binding protein, partial [Planctomycetia bacterium]